MEEEEVVGKKAEVGLEKEEVELKKKKKGMRFTLVMRITLTALLPTLLMAVVLSIVGIQMMSKGLEEEALTSLRCMAVSVYAAYDAVNTEDYYLGENGDLFKGDLDITASEELIDSFTKGTNMDVTIFYGDTRMATSLVDVSTNERIIGTKASEEVVSAVLEKGEEYASTNLTINNQPYYAHYIPLKNSDGTIVGMIFVGESSAKIDDFILKRVKILIAVAFSITVLAVAAIILVSFGIKKGINATNRAVMAASTGDLSIKVDSTVLSRNDELGDMASAITHLIDKLKEVVSNIHTSAQVLIESGDDLSSMASQTSASADEISLAVEDISKGALSQSEEIENAAARVLNMGNIMESISGGVEKLNGTSDEMKKSGDESTLIIQELSLSNDHTTDAITRIGKQIYATNESAQKIREAVNMISAIATETNLLSLNASIEAARAGEQGKGFAVVASEIQKLADQSSESARTIEKIIDALVTESEMTVSVMDEVEQTVVQQQEKLKETKQNFEKLDIGIQNSYDEAAYIRKYTETVDVDRKEVMDIMSGLSAISQENAAATQETTASMEELNATMNLMAESADQLKELSENLENDIKFFRL